MVRPKTFQWEYYGADALCWTFAFALAALFRYDFNVLRVPWVALGSLIVVSVLLQGAFGYLFKAYRGRHPWGSFGEIRRLALTVVVVAGAVWVLGLFAGTIWHLSRSLPLLAGPFALIFMFGIRYLVRYGTESRRSEKPGDIPVILYGAGYMGESLARRLITDTRTKYRPVAILDDDKSKRNLRLFDVPVRGELKDLQAVAEPAGARHVIVAIADPPRDVLKEVQREANRAGLKVLVMPPMTKILTDDSYQNRLRDLKIEDLLGRQAVDTNVSEIAGYLNGKRVLVTGAGGSIGSQLAQEIDKHGPSELMLLDRDETGLQQTEIEISGNGLLTTNEVILADIRDEQRLREIFLDRKPEVVFHAAALKHLPMLEQYPDEAWKTNSLGTLNVLQAARAADVETFINISTDKAANPTSVLGLSKRIAEQFTAWVGNQSGKRYLSVRFGNVIGSRGSMLPTFQRLIEEGKPLTVTHPDVTRYFMTIPEACQLVLQAGGIGRVGEVLILDMGEPVRILDIAEQMISMSGKDVDIVFTGLREGEKLDEELHSIDEVEERPFHALISHAQVPAVKPQRMDKSQWKILVEASPNDRCGAMVNAEQTLSSKEDSSV